MAPRALVVTAGLILSAVAAGSAGLCLRRSITRRRGGTAASHLQIEVDSVEAPGGGMGACPVEGSIVRVFRGPLKAGDRIAFTVSCYRYGSIPDGATLWTDYDALNHSRYLEAFMSDDQPPRVVLDQVEIILVPRDRPYCDSNSLYCESTVDDVPPKEECGTAGRIWTWLGLGECE